MTGEGSFDVEYVTSRRVLLDALTALGAHRKAVVLVGAQAIYLRVGAGDLAVAPFTTDADLAIDPRHLDDAPALANLMETAGFQLAVRPGTWALKHDGYQIDFLVPTALAGAGRRGARLGAHGTDVARKATGLEAAVVDHSILRVAALERGDSRTFDIAVANVGALLVAKLHKIDERKHVPDRLQDKDALDVLRILRHASIDNLGQTLGRLAQDPVAGEVTRASRPFLVELFADRGATGALMAIRASGGLDDAATIALSCEVLAKELGRAWRQPDEATVQ